MKSSRTTPSVSLTVRLNRAFSVADELIVLSQGRLVFKGGKEDFIRDEVYSKYFDLRMEMISTPSGRKYIFF